MPRTMRNKVTGGFIQNYLCRGTVDQNTLEGGILITEAKGKQKHRCPELLFHKKYPAF